MGNKSLKKCHNECHPHTNWKITYFRDNPKRLKSDPSLFAAIDANDCHRLRQLLISGHKINERDTNGFTALHLATINGSEECVELLIEFKAQLICCPLRQTPLHFAAINGTKNMINALLDYGSVINARDSMGSTPLASAVDVNNMETVRALLLRGAVLHPSVCASILQKGFLWFIAVIIEFQTQYNRINRFKWVLFHSNHCLWS